MVGRCGENHSELPMRIDAVDTAELVGLASWVLGTGGIEDLARHVQLRWQPNQICSLLQSQDPDLRKLVCLLLAQCGADEAVTALTGALRDDDAKVSELAEHALWSIWFRGGSAEARRPFRHGLGALADNKLDAAVDYFRLAQRLDGSFAEAYNQCAIAHYLAERWLDSIDHSEQALERNPSHFGALAGLGHSHFQLGNFAEASRFYRRALAIYPRMHCAAQALSRIGKCMMV